MPDDPPLGDVNAGLPLGSFASLYIYIIFRHHHHEMHTPKDGTDTNVVGRRLTSKLDGKLDRMAGTSVS
jgi:hypothetical protein